MISRQESGTLRGAPSVGPAPSAASELDALATVVRHHRAVFLFRASEPAVKAIDPTETARAAAAFFEWAQLSVGLLTSRSGRPALEGPREGPDGRQFFVYARPASAGDTVVLVSEAKYLLQSVLRSRRASPGTTTT